MLYFTETDKDMNVEAIYNGRFSFVLERLFDKKIVSKEDIENVIASLNNKQNYHLQPFEKAIHEEFMHKKNFIFCKSGLFLSGFRYFVRFIYLTTRFKKIIRYYYKIRLLFFSIMYPVHEYIEDKNDDNEIKKLLSEADNEVYKLWALNTGNICSFLLIFTRPLYIWMGKIFHENFTIVHVFKEGDDFEEYNIVEDPNNVMNLAGSTTFYHNTWRSKIYRALSFDLKMKNKLRKDWEWMLIKFQTEKKYWPIYISNINKKIDCLFKSGIKIPKEKLLIYEDFDKYLFVILHFSSMWSLLENPYIVKQVFWEIKGNLMGNNQSFNFLKTIDLNSTNISKFINFFYLHGN